MLVGCWLVAGWLFGWLFIGWLLGTTRVRRRAAPAPGDGWVCGWQVSVRLLVGFLKLLGGLWSCWLAAPRALGKIPECSYSSARSGAICRNKASWNPGSWSTSLARPVRSRCAYLRGFRHAFCTASVNDLASLESELWKTHNGIWNPDVLLYIPFGICVVRAGSCSVFRARPVRVI